MELCSSKNSVTGLDEKMTNQYPIYIPSRGRHDCCYVADILIREKAENIFIVVEPQDAIDYKKKYGSIVLIMDENNQGVAYARNFCKNHSIDFFKSNYHWQFDDNIKSFQRRLNNKNNKCSAIENISKVERTINLYKNIAVAGMGYTTFAFGAKHPISINKSPASGFIVNNRVNVNYRKGVPVDIDYTIQCLSKGYCSLVFNHLLIEKPTPLTMKGGCTEIEYGGDKREKRTLKLVEYWPDLVKIKYKYGRAGLSVKTLKITFKQEPILI